MKVLVSSIVLALALVPATRTPAQLIGKVPPAPAPSPEFSPPAPPPPPPPPATPPEPEKPLPSLVARDAAGKLVRYPQGTERAAIEAFGFDAEVKAKIAASEASRAADLERMVVEKLDKVIEARKVRDTLDQIKDFNEFARIKDVAAPLSSERLTDRLMRDGAITPMQRSRIDQVVKEYEEALKQEWQGQTGSDILKIASLIAREKFTEVTRDALDAFDRKLLAAAPRLAAAEPELALREDQRPAYSSAVAAIGAAAGDDPASKARRIDAAAELVTRQLDLEQARRLLGGP